ncbi:VOC family protein, partial [Streptococcus sobrinus]
MIDHFGIKVKDLQSSKDFYQKTLAPLGYELRFNNEYTVSFGDERSTD